MILSQVLLGILEILKDIIILILTPIDNLISEYIPSVQTGINAINNLFTWLNTFIDFIMSWIHLNPLCCELISSYILFIIVVRPMVYSIKIVLQWIKILK